GVAPEGITLGKTGTFTLHYTHHNYRSRYLYWHPAHLFVSRIGKGEFRYDKYSFAPAARNDVFDPKLALTLSASGICEAGEVITRDGLGEVLDIAAAPDDDLWVLRLISKSLAPMQWSFERETLLPWSAVAVEPITSHLISLAALVGALGQR